MELDIIKASYLNMSMFNDESTIMTNTGHRQKLQSVSLSQG